MRGVTSETALESIKEGVLPSDYALRSLIAGTTLSMHKFQRSEQLTYMRKMLSLSYEQTQTQRQILATLKAQGLSGFGGSSGWEGGFFSRVHTALQRQTASAIASTIREVGKEVTGSMMRWLGKSLYLKELLSGGTTFTNAWHSFKQNIFSALSNAERFTLGNIAKYTRLRPAAFLHSTFSNYLYRNSSVVKEHKALDALFNKMGRTIHAHDQNAFVKFGKKVGEILGKNLGNYGSSEQLDGTYRTGGGLSSGSGVSTGDYGEKSLFYQRGMLSYLKEIRDALYVRSPKGGLIGTGKELSAVSQGLKTYGTDEEFERNKLIEQTKRDQEALALQNYKLSRLNKQMEENDFDFKSSMSNLTNDLHKWWKSDHKWQSFKNHFTPWLKKRWENIKEGGWKGALKKIGTMGGLAAASTFFLSSGLGLPLWATVPLTLGYQALMRSHTEDEINKSKWLRGLQTMGKGMEFLSFMPFLAHPGWMWGLGGAAGMFNALRRQSATQYSNNAKVFLHSLSGAVQDMRALPLQLMGLDKTAAGLSVGFMSGEVKKALRDNYHQIHDASQLLLKNNKTDDEYRKILKDYGLLKEDHTHEEFIKAKQEYQATHEATDMRNAGQTLNWLQDFKKTYGYTDHDLDPEVIKAREDELNKGNWYSLADWKKKREYKRKLKEEERVREGTQNMGRFERLLHHTKKALFQDKNARDRDVYTDITTAGNEYKNSLNFFRQKEEELKKGGFATQEELASAIEDRNRALRDMKSNYEHFMRNVPLAAQQKVIGLDEVINPQYQFLKHSMRNEISKIQETTLMDHLDALGFKPESGGKGTALETLATGEGKTLTTSGILAQEINGTPSTPLSHLKDITITARNVYLVGKKWKKGLKGLALDEGGYTPAGHAAVAAPIPFQKPKENKAVEGAKAETAVASTVAEEGVGTEAAEILTAVAAAEGGKSLLKSLFSGRVLKKALKRAGVLGAVGLGAYEGIKHLYNWWGGDSSKPTSTPTITAPSVSPPIKTLQHHKQSLEKEASKPSLLTKPVWMQKTSSTPHSLWWDLTHTEEAAAPTDMEKKKEYYFHSRVDALLSKAGNTLSLPQAEVLVRKQMDQEENKYLSQKKALSSQATALAAHKAALAKKAKALSTVDNDESVTAPSTPNNYFTDEAAKELHKLNPRISLAQAQAYGKEQYNELQQYQKAHTPHKEVKSSSKETPQTRKEVSTPSKGKTTTQDKPSWWTRNVYNPVASAASWANDDVLTPAATTGAVGYMAKKALWDDKADDRRLFDFMRGEAPVTRMGKISSHVKGIGANVALGAGLSLAEDFTSSKAVKNSLSMNHGFIADAAGFLDPEAYLGVQGAENTVLDVLHPSRTKAKTTAGRLENTGLMMTEDAAAGSIIGSVLPGVGTVLGAGVGAGVGLAAANADKIKSFAEWIFKPIISPLTTLCDMMSPMTKFFHGAMNYVKTSKLAALFSDTLQGAESLYHKGVNKLKKWWHELGSGPSGLLSLGSGSSGGSNDGLMGFLDSAGPFSGPLGVIAGLSGLIGEGPLDFNVTPHTITSAQTKKNAEIGMKYLLKQGFCTNAAAALLGNFMGESNLNPQAVGDNGEAWGIAQWHPNRQENISNHFGKSIFKMNFLEQLKAALWEMKTGYPEAYNVLNKQGLRVKDYVSAVVRHYEIPEYPAQDIIQRTDNAYGVLQLWKKYQAQEKKKAELPKAANTDTPVKKGKGISPIGKGISSAGAVSASPPVKKSTGGDVLFGSAIEAPTSSSPSGGLTALDAYSDKSTHDVSAATKHYVKQVQSEGRQELQKSASAITHQTTQAIARLTSPQGPQTLGKKETTDAVSQGTLPMKKGIEEVNQHLVELTKTMQAHNEMVNTMLKSQNKVTPNSNTGIVVAQNFTQHTSSPSTESDLHIRRPRQSLAGL